MITDRPILSVIIPAYNVQDWLYATISSVLEVIPPQTEVIVVNDGSTDATIDVANRFVEMGSLKLITIPNSGVSRARNTGLAAARGTWVWFLDGDDIAHGLFPAHELSGRACDVLSFPFFDGSPSTLPPRGMATNGSFRINGGYAAKGLLDESARYWIGSTIVRRSLLQDHSIRFSPGARQGEDVHWLVRVFAVTECVVHHPEVQICHVYRATSATACKSEDGMDAFRLMRRLSYEKRSTGFGRSARARAGRELIRTLRRVDVSTRYSIQSRVDGWYVYLFLGFFHACRVGQKRDTIWALRFLITSVVTGKPR